MYGTFEQQMNFVGVVALPSFLFVYIAYRLYVKTLTYAIFWLMYIYFYDFDFDT